MAKRVQYLGASNATLATEKGLARELIINTDTWRLHVMDGTTDGGHALATLQDISTSIEGSIDANDLILGVENGKIKTTLGMEYTRATGVLNVTGEGGTVVATATIPSSYTVLVSASLVTEKPAQGTEPAQQGQFLKMTFRLYDDTTEDVYVDLTDLVDIYTQGNGITVSQTGEISVRMDASTGLKFDAQGRLALDYDVAKIVSTDTGQLIVKGTDGGALLTKTQINTPVRNIVGVDMINDGTLATNLVSPNTGNMIEIVNGQIFVPSDYGTL